MSDSETRRAYSTDLSDEQWAIIEPVLSRNTNRTLRGRRREVSLREVVNAIMYIDRTGCQWELLPHDLPPKSTVHDYFAKWRDNGKWNEVLTLLRTRIRVQEGRDETPSAAWTQEHRPTWTIEVQSPPPGSKGFSPVRIRWVVERSNAWHGRCRRNSKDYERRPDSSEAMIQISHIGIMLRKCAPVKRPVFNYVATAA